MAQRTTSNDADVMYFIADGAEDDVPTKLQEIEIQVLNTSSCRDLMPVLNQQSVQDEMVCIWDPRDVADEEKRGICQVLAFT